MDVLAGASLLSELVPGAYLCDALWTWCLVDVVPRAGLVYQCLVY